MKISRRVLGTLALAAAASGLASAGQVSFLSNVVGPTNTEVTYALNLPKFDPSLGTLTGAILYFRASESTSNFTVTNTAAGASTFDLSVTSNLVRNSTNSAVATDNFTGEVVQLFDTGIGTASGNCTANPASTVAPNNGCASITLGAGASQQYAPFTINNTDTNYGFTTSTGVLGLFGVTKTIAPANLGFYTGAASTFTLGGVTKGATSFSGGGGNLTLAQATTGTFRAEIDYTYTAPTVTTGTPEPATMALFGSALLGIGLLRKKLVKK